MATPMNKLAALLDELKEVIEEERRILLSGSPERITAVVARKLALAERIETEGAEPGAVAPSIDVLTSIARSNRQNSVICAAMLRHLTRAIDQLRQHELHRSYGPDGAERSAPAQHPLGAA